MKAAHPIRWLLLTTLCLASFPATATAQSDPVPAGLMNRSKRGQVRSITDRRTADGLLKRSRQALDQGNVELAEWYVERAEALNVKYDSVFQRFVDTPEKVREAIGVMKRTGQVPPPPKPAENAPPDDYAAAARQAVMQAESTARKEAKAQVSEFLQQGRLALAEGDVKEAVAWYEKAAVIPTSFTPDEYSPAHLAQGLQQYGVDTAKILARLQAQSQPEQVAEVPPTTVVDPATKIKETPTPQSPADNRVQSQDLLAQAQQLKSNDPASTKAAYDETMRLLSEARVALDRGELKIAENLARSAQALRVPDEAYQVGDTRPWMLLMELSRRQDRIQSFNPTALAGSIQPPPPAAGTSVAHTGYDALPNAQTVSQVQAERRIPPQSPNWDPAPTDTFVNPVPPVPELPAPQMINNPTVTQGPFNVPSERSGASSSGLAAEDTSETSVAPVMKAPNGSAGPPPAAAPPSNFPAESAVSQPNDTRTSNPPSSRVQELADQDLPEPSVNNNIKLSPPPSQPEVTMIDDSDIETAASLSEGELLVREGELALSQGKQRIAQDLFQEAWQYEETLPPDVRQRLQDYVQASNTSNLMTEPETLAPGGLSNAEKELVREVLSEMSRRQATIISLKETEPMRAWDEVKQLREYVATSKIDEKSRKRLLQRVDRRSNELEEYIDTNRARIETDERNREILAEVDRMREQRLRTQQMMAELVDKFERLIDEQRYPEAQIVAKQAVELDPLNPVAQTIRYKADIARSVANNVSRNLRFENGYNRAIEGVLDSSVPSDRDFDFPDKPFWNDLTRRRRKMLAEKEQEYSEVEVKINQALKTPVDVQFEDTPLSVVVERLSQMTGVNIFLDPEGVEAEGHTASTTVSLQLRNPVQLKSALNLILSPLHLSYVVQDEVLRITSEQVRDSDLRERVYPVADLVIPIRSFGPGNHLGLPAALREAYSLVNSTGFNGNYGGYRQVPFTMGQKNAPAEASVLAQMGLGTNAGMGPGQVGGYAQPGQLGGGSQADFATLMELITTTVSPESWEEVGGTGTIAPFPTNLSLVVAQTQEVHEKIVDLLAQLRRLQDLQVTIEVRFITLNDNFFERIGVDFDFDIDDNTGLTQAEVLALDDDGPSVTVGLDPSGSPTVDLDIGFTQGSFGAATPTFGGFDANTAANIGFAILSDIEAFFVIQAAQGDTRTNVLQAPKVTLFNGASAFVADQSQRPFVTSIIPVVGDFAAAHQPVITVLTEGTSLSVQAVVSQDRRFVRLTLVPFFSQITDVDTFTFDGVMNSDTGTTVIDPTDETDTVTNNAVDFNQGTTVQLPTLAFTSVTTTVSVPDGGTILLGGIKRLSEGRTERGVPMLSNLPYINRLFKNVGIGRETQSLMMMVTPRIIIQEEEEEKLGLSLP